MTIDYYTDCARCYMYFHSAMGLMGT